MASKVSQSKLCCSLSRDAYMSGGRVETFPSGPPFSLTLLSSPLDPPEKMATNDENRVPGQPLPLKQDSDDVQQFLTLGGEVTWAVNAYRSLRPPSPADTTDASDVPIHHTYPESANHARTMLRRPITDDALWNYFMSVEASIDDTPDGTSLTDGGISGPDGQVTFPLEQQYIADGQPSFSPSEPTADSFEPGPAFGPIPLQVESAQMDVDTHLLAESASYRMPVDLMYPSGYRPPVRRNPTFDHDDTQGVLSQTQQTAPAPRGGVDSGRRPGPEDASSSSQVPIDPARPNTSDLPSTQGSPSGAGTSRGRGKGVIRSIPSARAARAVPYTHEGPPVRRRIARKKRKGFGSHKPPPGFVPLWRRRLSADDWTWNGQPLPMEWRGWQIWDKLLETHELHEVSAVKTSCGWAGCEGERRGTSGLKRHIEGVHLWCRYRCTGCDKRSSRFDMWKARTYHKPGCPVAAQHPGSVYESAHSREQEFDESLWEEQPLEEEQEEEGRDEEGKPEGE
ncbi:hypothetical protein BV20DRAFT_463947 [Pilatotrama ljubarskyi]|nr:hypothetical protein BV20DRAFT_463947 [Pilatotrama ljubarskyi]